jgi:pilus assembly protein CpaC
VSQGGTGSGAAISVDYREYGVKLKFVPIVLGNGKIRLKVSPEISDLDYANSVEAGGFKIPGITQRKVTTTIELADGQSFAIAGLLNTSIAANKDVTPLLGDLPVIGPAFRTVRYSRKETEMVVLVTPHLVEPLNPSDVQRLPGEEWRSPTENELFWNQDLGGEVTPRHVPPAVLGKKPHAAPKFHGEFGFVPAGGSKDGDPIMHAPYATTKD